MSMNIRDLNTPTPATAPAGRCPQCDQYLFANAVQGRREELGLSIFEAAELSGMALFQWAAVEEGCWVPDNTNLVRSMAGALEANALQMILVASVSAWALGGYKTKHPPL